MASGGSLWLLVYGSAPGVCLGIRESIANAGMRNSFGVVQLSGKLGEKRKYCRVGQKELEDQRRESVCFPLVSLGVLIGGRRDSHGVAWALMGG